MVVTVLSNTAGYKVSKMTYITRGPIWRRETSSVFADGPYHMSCPLYAPLSSPALAVTPAYSGPHLRRMATFAHRILAQFAENRREASKTVQVFFSDLIKQGYWRSRVLHRLSSNAGPASAWCIPIAMLDKILHDSWRTLLTHSPSTAFPFQH
ncbi:hypothetical protein K443DRAFT_315789 [Laccaria amethystina LaAM-08-1]|uniref:Uncharacterized protein n=1 Tax=Laccaria amethystina LaAM-08-1 TaxID=1095629 RepID=A0A0C9X3J5_9AGAR|nr:hypothetical protein K443DRAFT_315789 [Laccaria amethystina LaAM-08-1]